MTIAQKLLRPSLLAAGVSALGALLIGSAAQADPAGLQSINNIIVIYQENWSFDGLYGSFPGANGIPASVPSQIERVSGSAISTLPATGLGNAALSGVSTANPPPPLKADSNNSANDPNFLDGSGNLIPDTRVPYSLSSFINPTVLTGDIYHRYWQEQFQINGANFAGGVDSATGNNQGFVTWSDNPGLVMSHFDASGLPEGLLAQQYTLCDNFCHSAFGGSFLNHQFLIAASAPVYDNMPTANNGNIAYLDAHGVFNLNTSGPAAGRYVRDGSITPVNGDVLSVTYNGSPASVTVGGTPPNGVPAAYNAAYVPSGATFSTTTFLKHYVVNTTRSANLPSGTDAYNASAANNGNVALLPSLNDSNASDTTRNYEQNIGDLLSQANVSWKWYSGGWAMIAGYSPANNGNNPLYPALPASGYSSANGQYAFQYHHQPFAYFDNYSPFGAGTVPTAYVGGFAGNLPSGVTAGQSGIAINQATNSAAHIQDETSFFSDVQNNTLPSVCFIKPVGVNNEHPGYATLQTGQNHVASIVQAVQANPSLWAHTAIIITYDEHGGRWDHVTPPQRDIWGPGERVPCLVLSPYARQGHVEHTSYDTTSILKTIEERFGLTTTLNSLDANSTSMDGIFTNAQITHGGLTINRRANKATQTVTVTNMGSAALSGPIQLVLDSLSSGTTLTNATGTAPDGSPYITVSGTSLAPGASQSITLQFTLPASGGITYDPSETNAIPLASNP